MSTITKFLASFTLGLGLFLDPRSLEAQSAPANRLPASQQTNPSGLDPSQSAALFVGVRHFTHDKTLAEVSYAVDDAVDLAFVVALDSKVRLVEPGRVILALSGEPQKEQSKQKLNHLLEAGASLEQAGQSDIIALLERQAAAVGKNGALIVSLATHGFTDEGNHFLAAKATLLKHRETALSENKILDIASTSQGSLSLILLDACRERLTRDSKGVGPDPRSAAPVLRVSAQRAAQAVLSAATVGNYAYDDDDRKNGVFSAAVVDGLQCAAGTDDAGFVTVGQLATYVNEHVTRWREKHHDAGAGNGIQISINGLTAAIPLASCGQHRSERFSVLRYTGPPARVVATDRFFDVFSADGVRLWTGETKGQIAHAEVADLDGDGTNEVIVGVGSGGDDTGKIIAYSATGKRLWTADTTIPINYDGGHAGKMAIIAFATGDLFRRGTRQVVALSIDAQGWYPSLLSVFGSDGRLRSTYWHPGHLHKVVIGSMTPRDEPRIIVAGVNNDLRSYLGVGGDVGVVFMLRPDDIRGEAPPYLGKSSRGSHLWYGVVTPGNQKIERLELFDRDQDGKNKISLWTSTRHGIYLDFDGVVVASGGGDQAEGGVRFGLLVDQK